MIDAWAALLASIRDRSDLWHAIGFAGGQSIMLVRTVENGRILEIDLSEYGIPEDARLYRVLNTPQLVSGMPMFTMSMVSQNVGRPLRGNFLRFWPTPFQNPPSLEPPSWKTCEVAFSIVWAPQESGADSEDLLRSSLGAFSDDDMVRSILDAQNAVDIATREALGPLIEVDGFSAERNLPATPQRAAIAKVLANAHGAPVLHPRVKPLVQKLNSSRNRGGVAHPGTRNVSADQLAELLAAAIVVVAYFEKLPALLATI